MDLRKRVTAISLVYIAVSIVTLLNLQTILNLDKSVFFSIFNVSNVYLDYFFSFITLFGSSIFWLALIVILWVKKFRKVAVYLIFAFVIDSVLSFGLKFLFLRPRPSEFLGITPKISELEPGPSFPSGHTERSFSGATVIGELYKDFRIPLYILAVLTAVSRIYLGFHYPLDTLYGVLTGLLIGKLVFYLPADKIQKRIEKIIENKKG